jgi:hypothetical protein
MLIRKTIFNFLLILRELFEEIEFQNTTLELYETNASLFAKVNVCKMFKIK